MNKNPENPSVDVVASQLKTSPEAKTVKNMY